MSATITWVIEWMQCKPTEGSLTDVVVTAGWRCNGVQDAYGASNYGSAAFPMPEGTFTPYEQLTQDQVLGWCWSNGVDKTATEASVQSQIDNQINPPIVQLPLPWAAA
jgi:hypothetical protein